MPKSDGTILEILKVLTKHTKLLDEHSAMLGEIRLRLRDMQLALPRAGEVSDIREDISRLRTRHADLERRVDALEQAR